MMYKIDGLVLSTGSDIKLKEPKVTIHQPTLKEIALIGGEEKLFQSVNVFFIDMEPLFGFIDSLEDLGEEEKEILKNESDSYDSLEFIMEIYSGDSYKEDRFALLDMIETILGLIIPSHTCRVNKDNKIILVGDEDIKPILLNRSFFHVLKSIVSEIFVLDTLLGKDEENEMSAAAKKIAEQMAEAEAKINASKGQEEQGSQFALMMSILSVKHPINYLSKLTIYQIFDKFNRFNLFNEYEQGMQAALAGAPDVEIVNWYKKI